MTRRVDAAGEHGLRPDEVLVEEPLEIRLDGARVATTMRTPGHDYELAVGFCFTDGLLAGAPPVGVRYCATGSAVDTEFNVVTVDTGGRAPEPSPRLGTTTSSCGWCGTDTIDLLAQRWPPVDSVVLRPDFLARLADLVRPEQQLFARTGGAHAAAVVVPDADRVELVREDIGRHNAVDKVIGRLVLDGRLPQSGRGLWVSGRASLELVQKAWAGGFGALVSVSAPSSLAVETATRAGLSLYGFTRSDGAVRYC